MRSTLVTLVDLPPAIAVSLALCCLWVTTSCDEEEVAPPLAVCTPVLDELQPSSGPLSGGTATELHGLFIATEQGVRDTRIQVGGVEATVTAVIRGEGCLACDQCILAALRCAECERVCLGETGWSEEDGAWIEPQECTEQVDFTTPPGIAPGPAAVIITTSRGSGVGLDFTYEASAGDDDDSAGDDDDSAGDDDDSAGDDDDSAGDDDDSAGDDDDSAD